MSGFSHSICLVCRTSVLCWFKLFRKKKPTNQRWIYRDRELASDWSGYVWKLFHFRCIHWNPVVAESEKKKDVVSKAVVLLNNRRSQIVVNTGTTGTLVILSQFWSEVWTGIFVGSIISIGTEHNCSFFKWQQQLVTIGGSAETLNLSDFVESPV